jgi:hypothetical protein
MFNPKGMKSGITPKKIANHICGPAKIIPDHKKWAIKSIHQSPNNKESKGSKNKKIDFMEEKGFNNSHNLHLSP